MKSNLSTFFSIVTLFSSLRNLCVTQGYEYILFLIFFFMLYCFVILIIPVILASVIEKNILSPTTLYWHVCGKASDCNCEYDSAISFLLPFSFNLVPIPQYFNYFIYTRYLRIWECIAFKVILFIKHFFTTLYLSEITYTFVHYQNSCRIIFLSN